MAIELTTVPTETAVDAADILYFNDVSETPDAINQITVANFAATLGAGITNSAGSGVIPKSDGTNLVASKISESGSTLTLGSAADSSTTLSITNSSANLSSVLSNNNGLFLGHPTAVFFNDVDQFPVWGSWQPDGLHLDQGHIQMVEITAPAAPAANTARLFVEDNGSGKTRLVVRFPTGANQVIATEP